MSPQELFGIDPVSFSIPASGFQSWSEINVVITGVVDAGAVCCDSGSNSLKTIVNGADWDWTFGECYGGELNIVGSLNQYTWIGTTGCSGAHTTFVQSSRRMRLSINPDVNGKVPQAGGIILQVGKRVGASGFSTPFAFHYNSADDPGWPLSVLPNICLVCATEPWSFTVPNLITASNYCDFLGGFYDGTATITAVP